MEKVERPWGWYINVKETPNQFIIRIDPVGSILIILELLLLRIRSSSQNKTHLRVSQQTSVTSNALPPQRTLGHCQRPSQSPSRKRRSIITHIIRSDSLRCASEITQYNLPASELLRNSKTGPNQSVYIPKECLHINLRG